MTTDEALARLRENWALSREDDFLTDAPGWAVNSLMNGEYYERLGWGRTVAEAIDAAEAKVEREAREQAERTAEYQRRKAAGLLTPLEIASEAAGQIWGASAIEAVSADTVVLSRLINRDFEGDIHSMGQPVRIEGTP